MVYFSPMKALTLGVSLLLASLVSACGSDEEIAGQSAAINGGVRESSLAAVGYLRRSLSEFANCTVTLIEPQIALTAAHCFKRFANGCDTLADTLRTNEVVFTPLGDSSDAVHFAISAIAIAPGAYSPSLAECGGSWSDFSCGDLPRQNSGSDMALIKLAKPVPSSLAQPLPVVTSINNNGWAPHGTHALLDSPTGPLLGSGSMPSAIVTGFGLSAECDYRRRIALMNFDSGAVPRTWHRGCVQPRSCDGSYVYSDTSRCEQQRKEAPGTQFVTNASGYDNIRLSRASLSYDPVTYASIYDGPLINHGDSGGPLLVWLQLPGSGHPALYVIGAASDSTNTAEACGEEPINGFRIADYAVPFGTLAGPWIERTIASWLDVSPPAPPHVPCRSIRCLPPPIFDLH
jgi:hypothetical protein